MRIKNKILVIDDYVDNLELTTDFLERHDLSAEGYTDPFQALEAFEEDPDKFDLIIMDVQLPNMRGTELYSKLKEVRDNVKIYLFTARDLDISKFQEICSSFRREHVIHKPVHMNSLLNTIHSAIRL